MPKESIQSTATTGDAQGPPPTPFATDHLIRQVLIALAALQFLVLSFQIYGSPWLTVSSVSLAVFNLLVIVYAFTARAQSRTLARVELFSLVAFSAAFLLYVCGKVMATHQYTTDEIAFDQFAATLFAHGHNPYTTSMASSLQAFHVAHRYWTLTASGNIITHLSYPALSFLLYVPFAGLGPFSAMYVDAACWVIAVWLMYFAVPSPFKAIALFIGAYPVFTNYVSFGFTDSLMMPLLIFLVWKWHFVSHEQRWKRFLPAITLGLVMSIKQTAWFLAPVLVIAVYKETRSWRQTLQFILTTGVAFLLPNLLFIAWSPVAWIRDIAAPFFAGLLPEGQGVIAISQASPIGGGYLSLYSLAAILLLLGLLVDEWLNYEWMQGILFVIPALILFLPTRSFSQYLLDFFPVFVVALFNLRVQRARGKRRRWSTLVYIPCLFALLMAIVTPSPLSIQNVRLYYSPALHGVDQIELVIQNHTKRVMTTQISVAPPRAVSFWAIRNGTAVAPGTTKTYVLEPKSVLGVTPLTDSFGISVYSHPPQSVLTGPVITPSSWHVALSHHGNRLTVTVEDASGHTVDISNYPIHVQKVDRNSKSVVSTQIVNTNASGSISLQEPVNQAFLYQAYIVGQTGAYGYSGIVS